MNIHQVAAAGDVASLRREMAKATRLLESYDDEGHTPLMVAAASKHAGLDVLRALIAMGADVNAVTRPRETPRLDAGMMSEILAGVDAAVAAQLVPPLAESAAVDTVLSYAVETASLDKIELLVEAGANVQYVDAHGYSLLLKAVYRCRGDAPDELLCLVRFLVDSGAPQDVASKFGETAINVASFRGDVSLVQLLLTLGADARPLEWSPLFHAVAAGDLERVTPLLVGDWQTLRDSWDRTAFLLSVHTGHLAIAKLLLERGSELRAVGWGGTTAVDYALSRDDVAMLRWLFELGFDLEPSHPSVPPLLRAVEENAVTCAKLLLEVGADATRRTEYQGTAISHASSLEMIQLFAAAGEELGDVSQDMRRLLLGGESGAEGEPSEADYQRHRHRTFGRTHPERMNNPFWDYMVRTRETAYAVAAKFGDVGCDREAVWCFQRFGHSLTQLPDGRYVEVGGEHEDFYDPDFCIYNDVVVHHGDGTFDIWGYPEDVFPATDFHTATYLAPYLYLIGSLGYRRQRCLGATQVMRLHCGTWQMEPIITSGKRPGWIHDHRAKRLSDREIEIWGGKIDCGEGRDLVANQQRYVLDLQTLVWRRSA